jgi:uncharacterized protein (DUF433 family)
MPEANRLTIEPGKRGGRPTIRGLRITVYDVLRLLADGASEAEILEDFPELEADDIRACLTWAADRAQHRDDPGSVNSGHRRSHAPKIAALGG